MSPLTDFSGKTAIVTGASSGIGAGLARALAKRGVTVALVARRRERLDQIAAEIAASGGRALVAACDVADRAQVEAAARDLIERLGGVDILVNCAGSNHHALFKDESIEEIERLMRVNYFGMVYWIKALLPALRARGRAWMVNLSSVAGKIGQPDEAAYAASKFAITGLSESLSYELEPLGIHVLCVYPALVRTEMFDEPTLARMSERMKKSFIEVEPFCAAVLGALERGADEVTVPRPVGVAYLVRLLLPRFFRRQIQSVRFPALPDLVD